MVFKNAQYTDTDSPEMLIYTHIGMDSELGPGVNGLEFANELKYLDTLGKNRICIRINSPGGTVDDGFSIFSAILSIRNTPIDTYNDGLAASTAGWIFCAGRNRAAASYSNLMMHEPYIDGEASDKDLEALESIKNSIASALAARSGKSVDEILYLMGEETWYDAGQQLSEGFATEIFDAADYNNEDSVYEAAGHNLMDAWKISTKILNGRGYIKTEGAEQPQDINTKNKTSMSKILAKSLGLSEDATEDQILKAINAMKDKAKNKAKNDDEDGDDPDGPDMDDLMKRMDDMSKRMDDCTNDLGDLGKSFNDTKKAHEKVHDDLGKGIDDLKSRMDDCEEAMKSDDDMDDKKNTSAVELINKYSARLGAVDAKTMTAWINKATKDPKATEEELSKLPLNVKSSAREVLNGQVVKPATANNIPPFVSSMEPNTGAAFLAEWYTQGIRDRQKKERK